MKAYLIVAAFSFGLTSVGSAALSGCSGTDCDCQATPDNPVAQAPLSLREAASYDSSGNSNTAPIQPVDGTLEITGEEVLIGYEQGGARYQVEYRVVSAQ